MSTHPVLDLLSDCDRKAYREDLRKVLRHKTRAAIKESSTLTMANEMHTSSKPQLRIRTVRVNSLKKTTTPEMSVNDKTSTLTRLPAGEDMKATKTGRET